MLPEVGQAPSEDSQDNGPNFLSPRTHLHRKDQVTLSFKLESKEPLKKQQSVDWVKSQPVGLGRWLSGKILAAQV